MANDSARQARTNGDAEGPALHASGAMKAAAAAAATGAATYAVRRVMSQRESHEETGDQANDESNDRAADSGQGLLAKKDDLTETLSAKAAGIKDAAAKLRPNRHSSTASNAWEAASRSLIPFAGEAAAAAGKAAAKKAPDLLRKELIPRFIDAFQKAS
jgi:hypothetical protein